MPWIIATASGEATKILEDGANAGAAIAGAFDQMWSDIINAGGGLYGAIANLGVLFAVGTLTLWVVTFAKDLLEDNYMKSASEIIWPLIVVTLLANQGQLLAQGTLALRGIINQTNQTVLESTAGAIKLQDAYKQVMQETGKQDVAQGLASQCASIVDPEQQKACLDNASAQSQDIAGGSQSSGFQKFLSGVGSLVQAPLTMAARGLLLALGIAFQWIIEVSMLLTALLGPLAVGGSLLPVGQRAIFAWLTGFFSVGIVKLSFNIICGLVATMVVNAGDSDPMIFAFATSLLAPVLSLVLAAGGGMAVFNSLSSASSFVLRW